MLADSLVAGYGTRLQQLNIDIDRARSAQNLSFGLLLAALAVFILFFALSWKVVALPLAAAALAGRQYAAQRARWLRAIRLRDFYERGVARIEDRWHGTGFSGEEFRVAHHVYDADLQILGAGSVFEFLCTARTGIGRHRLAEYLLGPCALTQSEARQASVRELKPLAGLRERIALLGRYAFQESAWETFSEWIAIPATTAASWVRTIALASSCALGALVLAGFCTSIAWAKLLPPIPFFFAIDMGIAFYFRRRTTALNAAARRVGIEIGVVREGIELIAGQTFRSAKLRAIQQRLSEGNAAQSLRMLERFTNGLAECIKPYFDLPSQALIVRTQLCFAIEEWKKRHGEQLVSWLDAWAEFEAMAAISGYAFEHPDDVFPQFDVGTASFAASGLGHPLIPASKCVRNDVAFNRENRFYVVSGSNMSGKSTLLRSIGANAVLAKAGAPVRAASLNLTDLQIFASLSIVDSILEGTSKFRAEVERVRQTLECARESPVLFLIDEILSGTNSRDRRIAAESIVRELVEHGAIGALSTHDLALAEIAELEGLSGSNVHMGSRSGQDPMEFDYVLKNGVTTESNGMAIFAMVTSRC